MNKTITMEHLLEAARQSEALAIQIAEAVQAELEKRPTAETVNATLNQLFTSVSDGKALIASAITDMGIATAEDASFQTMRDHILAIPKGDGLMTLQSLAVADPPAKTSYYYNGLFHEFFDPTGLTFALTVNLLGSTLVLPITPVYEAIDADRHKMSYDVAPSPPEGMSGFPSDFALTMTPDREVQDGDSAITATVSWRGQSVTVQQPITVAYATSHWYDIEKKSRTWEEFAEEFGTWQGAENA